MPAQRGPAGARDARRAKAVAARRKRARQPASRRGPSRLPWALGLGLVGAIVLAVVATGGSDEPDASSAPEAAGIHTGPPPWPPVYDDLDARVERLGCPPPGDESYHAHALLSVFVDGKAVTVPQNIGISPRAAGHSSLHTHTPDGVIHMEADDPFPYKLSDVFAVWGVKFGEGQLGGMTAADGKVLEVYENGELADDPASVVLDEGDNIVVGFGADGSFPTEVPDTPLRSS